MILVGKNLSAQVTPRISVSGSYLRQVLSGLGGFSGELCLGAKSKNASIYPTLSLGVAALNQNVDLLKTKVIHSYFTANLGVQAMKSFGANEMGFSLRAGIFTLLNERSLTISTGPLTGNKYLPESQFFDLNATILYGYTLSPSFSVDAMAGVWWFFRGQHIPTSSPSWSFGLGVSYRFQQ